jgi:hypothetical protein
MARNRVIYQSEALWCAKLNEHTNGDLTADKQLLRVQDISHGVELNRTDVNEFGKLAAIDRQIIEPPTVSLDFSYYLHGGRNETLLGFDFNGTDKTGTDTSNLANNATTGMNQAIGGFMTSSDSGRNFYISVAGEGDDAHDKSGANLEGVIGIGNGYITNYSVEAAVGDMPTASVSVEANNIRFNASGQNIPNPAINLNTGLAFDNNKIANFPAAEHTGDSGSSSAGYEAICVKPGDITVDFNDGGFGLPSTDSSDKQHVEGLGGAALEGDGQMHLQNFTLDIPMARTALNRLGNRYPYYRAVDLPLNLTFSCSAFLADIEDGNLNDLICSSATDRNIRVRFMSNCAKEDGSNSSTIVQEYLLKKCTLESQNFSNSIGDNKTVDLVFNCQVGGASSQDEGLFMTKRRNLGSDDAGATVNPRDAS